MRNRAARGGSEGENDKAPSTSKFHFSKGKYGNVVLAWHGVLVQKAKANFPDICAQARKIFGVVDLEIGNDNQRAQNINPEIRTRVGLDSESESEEDDEDHGNDDDRNIYDDNGDNGINYDNGDSGINYDNGDSGINYDNGDSGINYDVDNRNDDHGINCDNGINYDNGDNGINYDDGNSGINYDVDNRNGYKDENEAKSHECYNQDDHDAEKNDGGEETEEVDDPGPSRYGGRRGTKAWGRK
jgi:hypothetical protein